MQYFGGKSRISKQIVEVLNKYRTKQQVFIEPFVGACNISSLMDGERYCYDINEYLIEMFIALQKGWLPPQNFSEEAYNYIKTNKDEDKALTGFVGIGCSYSGKWFGGYARNNNGRNYCQNAYNSIIRQIPKIQDIHFECKDYIKLNPIGGLIYCDPPYRGVTQYPIGKFNSDEFWDKVRGWSINNTVIISEYNAPPDFKCIKEIETKTDIRNKKGNQEQRTEKLFTCTIK